MQVVFVLYVFATLIQGRHIKDTNIKKLFDVILDDIDEVKNTLKHENDEEHLSIYEVNKRIGLMTDEKSLPVNDDILAKRYVDASLHWLNQVQQGGPQYIPYVIESSDGSDVVGRIQSFIDSFNAQFSTACERDLWQLRTNEEYYVKIQTHENGCWSYVGNVGALISTYQPLNLQAPDCLWEGTVHHEMMHAMGFHHEQNRCDRDAYVEILTQNIEPDNLHNYDKEDASATQFYSKYDYLSVMHYANYYFSNGQPTMRYLDPNVNSNEVGGAQAMSYSDKIEIKKLYQCTLSAGEEPCVVLCNMPSTYTCGEEQPGCTCGAHGSCDGDSNCMCDPGFQSINNVCTQCTTTICDANAECVGPNQCACKDGFSGDGTTCTHFNCALDCNGPNEGCSSDETTCACDEGYIYEGSECVKDFDCERDCDWLNEGCSADKTECACIEGYEYGNNKCVKVAECAINQVDVHGKCRRNKWYRIFTKLNAMYEKITEYFDSYSFRTSKIKLELINANLKLAIGEIDNVPVENLPYLQVLINGFDHIGNEIEQKYPDLDMDTFWNLLGDLQTAIEGRL